MSLGRMPDYVNRNTNGMNGMRGWVILRIGCSEIFRNKCVPRQGTLALGEGFCTVDLLVKIACLFKIGKNTSSIKISCSDLVDGGELYKPFPFRKCSLL
jgi:hypothetical protein